MVSLSAARQGLQAVNAGLARKIFGHRRYQGTAVEICEQVVRACFHPHLHFFMTSPTTYREFWSRDFGRAVPALLDLGFEKEVGDTYRYALRHYTEQGRFSLVITAWGGRLDFPAYAPDGFAFFMWGLARLGDSALIARYRDFLQKEVQRFMRICVDPGTGLVKRGVHFSEAQDFAIRSSSCYSNTMCYLLQTTLHELRLENPLARYDYLTLIDDNFFREDHFKDDLDGLDIPSGDANLLPFWTGLIGWEERASKLFGRVLDSMDQEGLTRPLPCRYSSPGEPYHRMIWLDRFNKWQRDAVWPCLGLQLLEVERMLAPARFRQDLELYRSLVEAKQCFPEVLDAETGELFRGPFYMADDSMLWAANLWVLLKNNTNI